MRRRPTPILAALALIVSTLSATQAWAAGAEPPKVDRLRAYLIWEDSGELSKNMAKEDNTIIANGEKGSSVQMLIDVVLAAKPDSLFEGEQPFLYVTATSMGAPEGDPAILDTGFPLTYIGAGGEVTRTVIVDHNCNGFDLFARVMVGDKIVSELKKTFPITCGD